MLKLLLLCPFLLFMLGCETVAQTDNRVSRASYIGDRDSYKFSNITVTVKNEKNKMLNLNLTFSAIINSLKNSAANPKKSSISYASSNDVRSIVRRLQTRIQSQIIQEVLSLNPAIIANQQMLHDRLLKKAQSIFDIEYNMWSKSSYFKVKIVITSLYFTDISVGKAPSLRRW
jgi:hypothetical protein